MSHTKPTSPMQAKMKRAKTRDMLPGANQALSRDMAISFFLWGSTTSRGEEETLKIRRWKTGAALRWRMLFGGWCFAVRWGSGCGTAVSGFSASCVVMTMRCGTGRARCAVLRRGRSASRCGRPTGAGAFGGIGRG